MNVSALDGQLRSARSVVKAIYFERAIYSGTIKSITSVHWPARASQSANQPHDFSTETRWVPRTRLSDVCQVISRHL